MPNIFSTIINSKFLKMFIDITEKEKGGMQVGTLASFLGSIIGIIANIIALAFPGSPVISSFFQIGGSLAAIGGNVSDGLKHIRKCNKLKEIKGGEIEAKIRKEFTEKNRNKIDWYQLIDFILRGAIAFSIACMAIFSMTMLLTENTIMFKVSQIIISGFILLGSAGMKFGEKLTTTRLEKELNPQIKKANDKFIKEVNKKEKHSENEKNWIIRMSKGGIKIDKETYKIIEELPVIDDGIKFLFEEGLDINLFNTKKESFISTLRNKDVCNLDEEIDINSINEIINFLSKEQIEEIKKGNNLYKIIAESKIKTEELSKLTSSDIKEINSGSMEDAQRKINEFIKNKETAQINIHHQDEIEISINNDGKSNNNPTPQ